MRELHIFWDLSGVLLPDCSVDPVHLASTVGLDRQTWTDVLEQHLECDSAWSRLERGEMTLDAFVYELTQLIASAGGHSEPADELRYLWWGGAPRERRLDPLLYTAISQTLQQAKHYVATNNVLEYDQFWVDQVSRLPMSAVFNSSRMGTRKPERAFFVSIERHLATTPSDHSQLILIDDNRENCIAAVRSGWQAVHFKDAAQCVNSLMSLINQRY